MPRHPEDRQANAIETLDSHLAILEAHIPCATNEKALRDGLVLLDMADVHKKLPIGYNPSASSG